jgi:hypothetical protein
MEETWTWGHGHRDMEFKKIKQKMENGSFFAHIATFLVPSGPTHTINFALQF